jgi:CDP-glucose 4,6-dehydratase
VIGGGDFAADRIIPDAMRAFREGRELLISNPDAVRTWQHVLEPLTGYLSLIEHGLTNPQNIHGGWSFGPRPGSEQSVEALMSQFIRAFGKDARWIKDRASHLTEARVLRLDASKAEEFLGWSPLLDFEETVDWTASWYRAFFEKSDMLDVTLKQVDSYLGQRVRLTSPFMQNVDQERDHAQLRAGIA